MQAVKCLPYVSYSGHLGPKASVYLDVIGFTLYAVNRLCSFAFSSMCMYHKIYNICMFYFSTLQFS